MNYYVKVTNDGEHQDRSRLIAECIIPVIFKMLADGSLISQALAYAVPIDLAISLFHESVELDRPNAKFMCSLLDKISRAFCTKQYLQMDRELMAPVTNELNEQFHKN